jgi:hypothetical protein
MMETFEEFHRFLLLWGTPAMIREFAIWSAHLDDDDPRVQILALERFLLAIRADLGARATEPGDVMRIFLNDYDELMGTRPKVAQLPGSQTEDAASRPARAA